MSETDSLSTKTSTVKEKNETTRGATTPGTLRTSNPDLSLKIQEAPSPGQKRKRGVVIPETPPDEESDKQQTSPVLDVVELPKRTILSCNQPEKIVLIVDTALDETCEENQEQPLAMLKQAIQMFLLNKSAIDERHQFALMSLNSNEANWLVDFTSDINLIVRELERLKDCAVEDIFDLNSVFDLIKENVTLEPVKEDQTVPPTFVVRVILCYARSYTIPQLTKTKEIECLLTSPYFTVDTVMIHEPPSSDNHCAKISKLLQEIDNKGFAYFFSVERKKSDLLVAMAKLLGHSLQRPIQSIAKYSIKG